MIYQVINIFNYLFIVSIIETPLFYKDNLYFAFKVIIGRKGIMYSNIGSDNYPGIY